MIFKILILIELKLLNAGLLFLSLYRTMGFAIYLFPKIVSSVNYSSESFDGDMVYVLHELKIIVSR